MLFQPYVPISDFTPYMGEKGLTYRKICTVRKCMETATMDGFCKAHFNSSANWAMVYGFLIVVTAIIAGWLVLA